MSFTDAVFEQFHHVVEPESDCIYFFYCNVDDAVIDLLRDDYYYEICGRMVPLKSQVSLRRIKDDRNRIMKLVNSLLIRYVTVLYEKNVETWKDLQIEYEHYGKPFVGNRSYSYNSSDEDGIASLCVSFDSRCKIGIDLSNPDDIERFQISDLRDFYRSEFREIFTPGEVAELDLAFERLSRREQLQRLSEYWALKESLSKFEGFGLHKGLKRYAIEGPKVPMRIGEKRSSNAQSFTKIEDIELTSLAGHGPVRNACFLIPGTEIICSIMSDRKVVRVISMDAFSMVKFINESQG
ncbi:DEKNAAC103963 [Brettanomyces naardenensis]|uniref:holo-[acyl-carrier-protein] synthase n=1 Tax=Brettanomyces naardenensis TaxID=13370 RepID=A0A448YPR4_BRENA|nr:DEKNAAC103963 [Brettanomyces naardenensis]